MEHNQDNVIKLTNEDVKRALKEYIRLHLGPTYPDDAEFTHDKKGNVTITWKRTSVPGAKIREPVVKVGSNRRSPSQIKDNDLDPERPQVEVLPVAPIVETKDKKRWWDIS